MKKEHSPAPSCKLLDAFKQRTVEHCFWTKSEILPLELQPNSCRVLQDQHYERLGSTRTLHADVRIIAATNQDLSRMVEQKTFRADLDPIPGLSVFPISLPPLRERREDIPVARPLLCAEIFAPNGKPIDQVPEGVMELLQTAPLARQHTRVAEFH